MVENYEYGPAPYLIEGVKAEFLYFLYQQCGTFPNLMNNRLSAYFSCYGRHTVSHKVPISIGGAQGTSSCAYLSARTTNPRFFRALIGLFPKSALTPSMRYRAVRPL